MELQGQPRDGSIGASLKATYRALLARGLEAGEAANLTGFLHGLPSEGFAWTLPEIEGIIHQRIRFAAEQRAAAVANRRAAASASGNPSPAGRRASAIHDRRTGFAARSGSTHVVDSSAP